MDRWIARIYIRLLAAIESGNVELTEILREYVAHLEARRAGR